MKTRKIVEYHNNKKIFKEYYFNDKNQCHGLYKSWYASGGVWDTMTFINGNLHGSFTSLYENGKIHSTGMYNKGNLDGLISIYYPSGNLQRLDYYSEGKMVKSESFTDELNLINTIAYDLFCTEMMEYEYKMENFIGLFIDELELNNERTFGHVNKEKGELAPSN